MTKVWRRNGGPDFYKAIKCLCELLKDEFTFLNPGHGMMSKAIIPLITLVKPITVLRSKCHKL